MTSTDDAYIPDWDTIRLVAFDVDGTLYDQRRLRLRMAGQLVGHALTHREIGSLRVLRTYRRLREEMGERETPDFEAALVAATATATGRSAEEIRAVVSEWIDERPLRYLAACRYAGVPDLFDGLRRRGMLIGVLSDYPVRAKLEALGLRADHVVYAGDEGVGVLKPNPRGLHMLMQAAGVEAHETVLIGDRPSRDGLAARRAGAWPLIRSTSRLQGWPRFQRFDDAVFDPLLRR